MYKRKLEVEMRLWSMRLMLLANAGGWLVGRRLNAHRPPAVLPCIDNTQRGGEKSHIKSYVPPLENNSPNPGN